MAGTEVIVVLLLVVAFRVEAEPFRRDVGHPQWHHSAFHDIPVNYKHEMRQLLHSRAQVPFQIPFEINVVLVGLSGDGGYRYTLDGHKLGSILKEVFPTHRPTCLETAQQLDIEHNLYYNVVPVGQPELLAFEQTIKAAMVHSGKTREKEHGKEVPLYEVEVTHVETIFNTLYSYLFGYEAGTTSAADMNKPVPNAIFILNFDKVRMDPRNETADSDAQYRVKELSSEELKNQEGGYVYRYRYNGGGATQVWLGSGRYAVIDLSAGPCVYGKIETEEGSVSYRTLPRLKNFLFPRGRDPVRAILTQEIFAAQLAGLIATTIEHVIAPDVRFETIDPTARVLIAIIALQNHEKYNLFQSGQPYTIDVESIVKEARRMLQPGQDVVVVAGSHSLHEHEKLAVAVSKALRGESIQETKEGRFRVRTRTFLDGAVLRDEMRQSGDVLAAGLLESSEPSLFNTYFGRYKFAEKDPRESTEDSVIKSKPLWSLAIPRYTSIKGRAKQIPQEDGVYVSYGTRVIPVFVLSLAEVDPQLMMDGESLLWASHDSIFVLQHGKASIDLSYVSETEKLKVEPISPQRHILAGLASVLGGLVAPYEKASHIHERPVLNWLWASGCHPFGPFSNHSGISQLMADNAIRNGIYARVDKALRNVRDMTENIQAFASEHLKTTLGEPVKTPSKKTTAELWLDKFYKKTTNMPEPLPHELVVRIESYLDKLEEQLVELAAMLYNHQLQDAHRNSTEILRSSLYTQQYTEHMLMRERDRLKCCRLEHMAPVQSSQAFVYGGILVAGFLVYFLVIFFSSPE
ncbi:hypothetical protein GOP47_0001648 [Adiantum capillus-veneris]|uniref:DUF7906 domain-containing protein n=1 Tax=Adiantum capillus-veneris TaxID=13818 RepID=A0A9D4V9F3_ADICA|nr:hypothetical protein GOP47_0001648 [Adiantum capillus-veneris]